MPAAPHPFTEGPLQRDPRRWITLPPLQERLIHRFGDAASADQTLTLHLHLKPREGGGDPLLEFRGVQAAHGVLHDDQVRIEFPRLGLGQDQRLEGLRRDDDPLQATLTQFDAVVETPR